MPQFCLIVPKSCAELGICITNDDLLLIPEVIAKGERTEKGKSSVYKLRKDGIVYTVLSEQQDRTERFCDFYSNKKGGSTRSSNTQLSAQAYSETTLDAAKVGQNSDNDKNSGENLAKEFSVKADKQKQLDIINRTNPAHDDYHTWIRTTDDIKTLQEAVDEVKAEDADYNLSTYPDVTDDMINEALQSGKITIYSSKPIKEGAFVTPSKMQAKDYAGGGRIYSKQVPINDVAWINTDEGMFAPVEYSVKGKQADESVLDYAKRMSEETGKKNLLNGDADYSVVRGGSKTKKGTTCVIPFSDPYRIQTCNLLIRSQTLYSVELMGQSFCFCECKDTAIF